MPSDPTQPNGDAWQPLRRRRPRYSGTHPQRFEERYKERAPDRYPEMQRHVRAQGRTPAGTHVPIMVEEVLSSLHPQPGGAVADCTLGFGGHAERFLEMIGPSGRLIGLDIDGEQLRFTAKRLHATIMDAVSVGTLPASARSGSSPVHVHRCHFAGLAKVMKAEGLDGFDVIFADLGVSSVQIDDPSRGFSYKFDGPLDMRMDDRLTRTASDIVVSATEQELSEALWGLADEPDHDKIAKRIVQYRRKGRITRTQLLVQLIFEAKKLLPAEGKSRRSRSEPLADEPPPPPRPKTGDDLHPAARTFQALRILVNDELTGLEQFLRVAPYCLSPGGRLGILSFHSGEHRRIEDAFRCGLESGLYATISAEPLRPSPKERFANPRSRSAQLRWAKRSS